MTDKLIADAANTYSLGHPDGKNDPTPNVQAIVDQAVRRLDDLQSAEGRYNDLRANHSREMATMRASHQIEMATKESSRLDSIRQVDREEVNKTAIAAQQAITTLANSTIVLKDTLQAQVAATALAVDNKQAIFQGDVNKRLSNLELASSEGKGKSGVTDPQMTIVLEEIKALRRAGSEQLGKAEVSDPMLANLVQEMKLSRERASEQSGRGAGMNDSAKWIIAGLVFLFAAYEFVTKFPR